MDPALATHESGLPLDALPSALLFLFACQNFVLAHTGAAAIDQKRKNNHKQDSGNQANDSCIIHVTFSF